MDSGSKKTAMSLPTTGLRSRPTNRIQEVEEVLQKKEKQLRATLAKCKDLTEDVEDNEEHRTSKAITLERKVRLFLRISFKRGRHV